MPADANDGAQPPARPIGLQVSTAQGSLDVSVDWNDVDGAASYLVYWRLTGPGHKLNEGVEVGTSEATITVDDHGEWVVRVEACNGAGCGLGAAKRFTVKTAPQPTPELTPPEPAKSVPARPTGLRAATHLGSLDVSVDWDDGDGADSYLVRWGVVGLNTPLNDGVQVQSSNTTITVASQGDWVVRVEACNDAGCSLGTAKRFNVQAPPEPVPEPTPEPTPEQRSEQLESETVTVTTIPGQPTGLRVAVQSGSLDVSADWDDVAGADSYLVCWRVAGPGNQLNNGVRPSASEKTITVSELGEWVVRVEACNETGCAPGAAKRFTIEAEQPINALVPTQPTGLQVVTVAGSLDVSVDWDEIAAARNYLVRWREAGAGNQLNRGTRVQFSDANITVSGYGKWVLRVEACNHLGCGPSTAKVFNVEQVPVPTPVPNPTGVISVELSSNASERTFVNKSCESDGSSGSWRPGGFYAIGDEIEVTVRFDAEVTVGESPTIGIALGHHSRRAQYVRASGQEVVFAYQVREGDEDTDGIHIPANSIRLNDGDFIRYTDGNDAAITHSAIPVQTKHKVDGIRPRVTSAEVVSSSKLNSMYGTYVKGERIFVRVTFSESVVYHEDFPPAVQLDFDGESKSASHRCGWWFGFYTYVVQDGDFDADGLTLTENSLGFPEGGYIRDRVGNDATMLTHSGHMPPGRENYKVDGRAPSFVSAHTSADGEEVVVVFDESTFLHLRVWRQGKNVRIQHLLDTIEIRVDDEVATGTSARIPGKKVIVVLEEAIQPGQSVTVAYTNKFADDEDPLIDWLIEDFFENAVKSFSAQTVRNDVVSQSEN